MAALPNTIVIGDPLDPLFVFHNAEEGTDTDGISKVGGVFAVDVVGDELSVDTATAYVQIGRPPLPVSTTREVYITPEDEIYISPNNQIYYDEITNSGSGGQTGDISAIPYGTPFRWTCDGRLIASFYVERVDRVGRWQWKLTAVSGVGLLDKLDHVGGIYTGQTFQQVATEIVGGAFPFTTAPALANQVVYGWLPYDTRRKNLHRLLLALGASMRRDQNGEATFVFLTSDTPTPITDDRIALGGSVTYNAPATRAEVTEHTFFSSPNDPSEQLFDNTTSGATADNTLVKFNAPMHDLTATSGLTIESSGVNYAYVTGTGTLTGKAYSHITRVVEATAVSPAGTQNVKHLRDDFTLVTLVNSLNVAKRTLAFYSGARTVAARIKLLGERCGDVLSMKDPFYDAMLAFVQTLDVNASSNLLGTAQLVENYTPQFQGNNISTAEVLTGTGTWVSDFTGELTVTVISGGQGGGCGNAGQQNASPSSRSYGGTYNNGMFLAASDAKAGKGGQPGTPGSGGKVYTVTINVTEGQEIAYSCGVGGAGEVFGSGVGHGADGTDTAFGNISSASGTVSPTGYVNPISGELYGTPGDNGIAGNDGTGWEYDENNNLVLVTPEPILANGSLYSNGANGETKVVAGVLWGVLPNGGWNRQAQADANGSFGGGAAYGANGNNGTYGSGYFNPTGSSPRGELSAAVGGTGATALPPPKATGYGHGGTSGNGGGGAGAVGAGMKNTSGNPTDPENATTWIEQNWIDPSVGSALSLSISVTRSNGGDGSDGGEGADGAIILFRGE